MSYSSIKTDRFGNPIFSAANIIELLYSGCGHRLNQIQADPTDPDIKYFNTVAAEECTPQIPIYSPPQFKTLAEFDADQQAHWYMPQSYKTLDIESYVLSLAKTDEELERAAIELIEFKQRGLINLLRWLKYFVDTCREKKILWGLGRGSSVASYVLYLIGVHKINPIKFGIPFNEFAK